MKHRAGAFALLVLALPACITFAVSPALADPLPGQDQESRVLSDRVGLTLGGYRPDFSTNVAAGFGGLLGAVLSVERNLGVEEELAVFRFGGFYRFKPKHAIDWNYSLLNRDGVTAIEERIEFGDPPKEFKVGALVATTFDSALFAVNYKYSFINNGKIDAGVSIGAFTYTYDLSLKGQASIVGSGSSETQFEDASARVLAPLPAVGIYINYAMRKNLIFRGEAKFLNLEIGDFTGKFTDTLFTLDWYFYKHVGLGVGANRTAINFQDKGDDPFLVDYGYGGFMAYVSVVF